MTTSKKMEGPKVDDVEAQGKKYAVHVHNHGFMADVEGKEVYAQTWDEVERKVRAEAAKAKVEHAIPVVLFLRSGTSGTYVRATLRGVNSRTHHALLTLLPSGEKVTLEHPSVIAKGSEMTDDQIAEVNRLMQAARAAEQATDDYVKSVLGKDRSARSWINSGVSVTSLIDESNKAAGVTS